MGFWPSLFLLSQFPVCWASCHFHLAGFSSPSASTVGVFTELGFFCVWPWPRGGQAEVVSARLNPSNGTIDVMGVCNFLGSVLLQQKFEATDGPVLQLSFIWQVKENTSLRCEGRLTQRLEKKRDQRPNFGSFYCMFFLLTLSLPYVNWASQEGCLFYLKFSLQSLDLPLFYF